MKHCMISPTEPPASQVQQPYTRPALELFGDVNSLTETGSKPGQENSGNKLGTMV